MSEAFSVVPSLFLSKKERVLEDENARLKKQLIHIKLENEGLVQQVHLLKETIQHSYIEKEIKCHDKNTLQVSLY